MSKQKKRIKATNQKTHGIQSSEHETPRTKEVFGGLGEKLEKREEGMMQKRTRILAGSSLGRMKTRVLRETAKSETPIPTLIHSTIKLWHIRGGEGNTLRKTVWCHCLSRQHQTKGLASPESRSQETQVPYLSSPDI